MAEHEKALRGIKLLSDDAKKFIQTFHARMATCYEHEKIIKEMLNALAAYKEDPSQGLQNVIFDKLNKIKSKVLPTFSTVHPTLDVAEADIPEDKLHDFEQLAKDLKEKTTAVHARKKIVAMLRGMREEIRKRQEKTKVIEHLKELISLAEGFVKKERQLISEEIQLIQRTEKIVANREPATTYDNLIYEWRTFINELDRLLRQEKVHVIDHLSPLFKEKTTIASKVKKLIEPWEWIKSKTEPTPEQAKMVTEGAKITKEDIARDIHTFTSPGETQQYQSLLMRHFDLLDSEAREFLTKAGYVAGQRSVAEEKKLSSLASLDRLTQFYTRRFFEERFAQELAASSRTGTPLSVLLIDADHFKQFNDTYGHDVGDQVLVFICRTIKQLLRAEDVPCRWGGEELAILLPRTNKKDAVVVAERIRVSIQEGSKTMMDHINQQFKQHVDDASLRRDITVSIGVGTYPENGNSYNDLMTAADANLYNAKRQGRNQVRG